MQYVHVECLDTWRLTSTNSKSFFQCDTCHFQYRFGTKQLGQFSASRLLAHAWVVHVLALLGLLVLCFAGGFVAKSFDSTLTWTDVVRCLNLQHMVAGATATGLLSLMGWATTAGGIGGAGGVRGWLGGGWHRAGGGGGQREGDALATLLMVIAIVVGLCFALHWIYAQLEAVAKRTVRMAQHVVLDVSAAAADGADAGAADSREASAPGAPAGQQYPQLYEHID